MNQPLTIHTALTLITVWALITTTTYQTGIAILEHHDRHT